MDEFNEEHANILLSKEWLVKVDAQTSTPYLIKFHSSTVDLTCCLIITDTKRTWAEVLSSNQFARRWRQCNNNTNKPDEDDEEAWRTRHLDLLSRAHTLGGIAELSFEVVQSNFGDFAFELECNVFKWRWETLFVGHKISADILSKHLIMPLISVNHLAFSSSDLVGDLPPNELEKAIDKVARTARRTVDTHVKNALSKPRLATTIRRITAVFNFISDPPSITTETEVPVLLAPPELTPKITNPPSRLKSTPPLAPSPNDRRDAPAPSIISKRIISPPPAPAQSSPPHSRRPSPINKIVDDGSETESEEEEEVPRPSIPVSSSKAVSGSTAMGVGVDQQMDVRMRSPSPSSREPSTAGGARARSRGVSVTKGGTAPPSDTDSSPVRPIKKPKPRAATESDEDSEEERKKMAARNRSGGGDGPASRGAGGVRQPIKRGGKRF